MWQTRKRWAAKEDPTSRSSNLTNTANHLQPHNLLPQATDSGQHPCKSGAAAGCVIKCGSAVTLTEGELDFRLKCSGLGKQEQSANSCLWMSGSESIAMGSEYRDGRIPSKRRLGVAKRGSGSRSSDTIQSKKVQCPPGHTE